MEDLQERFGSRDSNFEFGRILLGRGPHISCPSISRIIDIHLTETALVSWPDETLARWQLAHECLHLIDPHKNPTNVLEEGLATWYQYNKVTRKFAERGSSWDRAEKVVRPFMNTLPAAIRRIRKDLRLAIGDIPEDVLLQYCPEVGAEAQKLTASFGARRF